MTRNSEAEIKLTNKITISKTKHQSFFIDKIKKLILKIFLNLALQFPKTERFLNNST